MKLLRNTWGVSAFGFAIGTVLCSLFFIYLCNPIHSAFGYNTLAPFAGIIFSLFCCCSAHVSYSRIQNPQLFILGYQTCLFAIAYYVFFSIPSIHTGGISFAILFHVIVLIVLPSLKSTIKYKTVIFITITLVSLEILGICLCFFFPSASSLITAIPRFHPIGLNFVFCIVTLCIYIVVTTITVQKEFSLGGILSGIFLLVCTVWFCPFIVPTDHIHSAENVLMLSVVVYTQLGIGIHWFKKMESRTLYDPVLGIYNKNSCMKILHEQSRMPTSPPLTLAVVDLDAYTRSTDTPCHSVKEQIHITISHRIAHSVDPSAKVCIYDERHIIVFFPKTTLLQAMESMKLLKQTIDNTKVKAGRKNISIMLSCGISSRHDKTISVEQTVQAAVKALQRAKNSSQPSIKIGKVSSPTKKNE